MSVIDSLLPEVPVISPSETFIKQANYSDLSIYEQAQQDRLGFWESQAKKLYWHTPWKQVLDWQRPYAKWFVGGTLNASENCLDVQVQSGNKNKAAIIWEGEQGDVRTLTYYQLYLEVNRFAAVLQDQFNVAKGDRVTIYMPMIPEAVVAILACARIGAIHSVVFGGFSAVSLRDRIADSNSKVLVTADGGYRRGSIVPLKQIADEALDDPDSPIAHVVVVQHVGERADVTLKPGRDHDYTTLMRKGRSFVAPVPMDSEDVLFILYTSGTTGKPKGIVHTTGGYLTHAKFSTHAVFDLKPGDIYWCTADIGWITGHTYLVYGPLLNGATCMMFEGSPDYPDKDRFWEIISRHHVSIFYTAPTAIRSFMKWGTEYPDRHDLSSVRLLGSVGEPINPEAWDWYFRHIGGQKCPVVDTWWQTETGGIMISNLPGMQPMKPGFAGPTLPGISAKILSEDGTAIPKGGGLLSLTEPWPSMLRGIWGDNERYESVYWSKFDTYFAGDGAKLDDEGYYMVLGRVDDVLNVAGHRIGTMEVESTIVNFNGVAEAAVVGMPDEIKGQAIVAFVTLKEGQLASVEKEAEIIRHVAAEIGAIAKPKKIIFTPELPKTRSGKIMRRLLKGIANGESAGDTTTLANPDIIRALEASFKSTV